MESAPAKATMLLRRFFAGNRPQEDEAATQPLTETEFVTAQPFRRQYISVSSLIISTYHI